MIEEKTSETKKKNTGVKSISLRFLFVLFFLGFVVIRGLSLLPSWGNIVDSYGYYSAAVIGQEQMSAKLSSGISYAYTESLSDLISIIGNEKWFVAVYHILLQIITFGLLILGCNMLFDKVTACVSSVCMLISPWLFKSVFKVSPENYYLFFWSVVLCLVGVYFKKGRKSGWCRNNVGEGFLLLLGFFTGILCVWHYFSVTLVILIVYAMVRNSSYVKERVNVYRNLLDMEMLAETEPENDADDNKLDEKHDPMSNVTQMIIIFSGIFLGGYCTLMKYTGVTGMFLGGQFKWWISGVTLLETGGRWQNIAIWLLLQVFVVICIGIISVTIKTRADEKEVETTVPDRDNVEVDVVLEKRNENFAENLKQPEKETEISLIEKPVISAHEEIVSELADEEDDWRFDIELLEEDDWRFDEEKESKEEPVKIKTEIKEDAKMIRIKKTDKKAEERRKDPERHKWASLDVENTEVTNEKTEEQPKVELLENPLPLPKKHEKKVMDFDVMKQKDDFDFALSENDDFDV